MKNFTIEDHHDVGESVHINIVNSAVQTLAAMFRWRVRTV